MYHDARNSEETNCNSAFEHECVFRIVPLLFPAAAATADFNLLNWMVYIRLNENVAYIKRIRSHKLLKWTTPVSSRLTNWMLRHTCFYRRLFRNGISHLAGIQFMKYVRKCIKVPWLRFFSINIHERPHIRSETRNHFVVIKSFYIYYSQLGCCQLTATDEKFAFQRGNTDFYYTYMYSFFYKLTYIALIDKF